MNSPHAKDQKAKLVFPKKKVKISQRSLLEHSWAKLQIFHEILSYVVRHKMKFDLDPGSIFRLLLQYHSRKRNTM